MRLAWLTDIHLNLVTPDEVCSLAQRIDESGADAVLVGGDIAEADSFAVSLRQVSDQSNIPHYFVLGNHDYYRGSIAAVREEAKVLCRQSSMLDNLEVFTGEAVYGQPEIQQVMTVE